MLGATANEAKRATFLRDFRNFLRRDLEGSFTHTKRVTRH